MEREFDLEAAWTAAINNGTAVCRGGCGDRPTVMQFEGRLAGCWCRECWREVSGGPLPRLKKPVRRR